jgi:cytidine deaminase
MPLRDEDIHALIEQANAVRKNAYAPYSKYLVGAALRTKSGRVYTGVNIENAAYTNGICAERVAIFKAVSDGERELDVLALVTDNGGSPCGACRQVLAEFGLDTLVVIADASGRVFKTLTAGELLPGAFQPSDLKVGK